MKHTPHFGVHQGFTLWLQAFCSVGALKVQLHWSPRITACEDGAARGRPASAPPCTARITAMTARLVAAQPRHHPGSRAASAHA